MVSNKPRAGSQSRALPVYRVKARQSADVILVSPGFLWVDFHWLGRQLLCPGPACPLCGGGGSRERGYAVVRPLHGDSRRHCLLEISPQSMSRLSEMLAYEKLDVAPGLVLRLSRARSNSPLRAEPVAWADGGAGTIVPLLAVSDAVAVLHGLPVSGPGETIAEWSARVEPCAVSLLQSESY